jgi:hypothetical protein
MPTSDVDAEIRDGKTERNMMRSPLCRLPDDILVPIIHLTQIRPRFDPIWKPPEATRWTQVMATCTRMRALVVHTPSLWCFIDTDQPSRWMALCLERSLAHPLEAYLKLDPQTKVDHATSLLGRSSAAWIEFHTAEESQPFVELVLPELQFLRFGSHSAGRTCWNLDDRFLGNRCINLIRLEINHAKVSELPDLPSLQHLNISYSSLSSDRTHFASQLAARAPRLKTLQLSSTSIKGTLPQTTAALETHGMGALPNLEQVHVQGTMCIAWLILRELPIPRRQLNLSIHRNPPIDGRDEQYLECDIMTYAQRFWRRTCVGAPLPPVVLEAWHESEGLAVRTSISTRSWSTPMQMDVRFEFNVITAPEPILNLVTDLHIRQDPCNDDFSLDPDVWAVADHLPALKRMSVSTRCTRKNLEALQGWADRRTAQGRRVICVDFCPDSRPNLGHTTWDPRSGPLRDDAWVIVCGKGKNESE